MVRLVQDAVEWRRVEGEIVALDLRDSMYLSINASGTVLWPLLVDGTDQDTLVDELLDTYDIERPAAERDVDAFLSMLRERDLVTE